MLSRIKKTSKRFKGGLKMSWSVPYIVSQIFTIIMYILLGISYQVKNRRNVLILSFLSLLANGVAYIFLSAWTGLAMCIVALIRNIIFLIDETKNGKRQEVTKVDIAILIALYIISIVSAIFTYDGIFSLLSVFATMLYTYSVWQKSTKVYKLLGIPVGILWVCYNLYIVSIFGILLETILLISAIIGYRREIGGTSRQYWQL